MNHVGGGGERQRRSGQAGERTGAARSGHRQGLSQPSGGERSARVGPAHLLLGAAARTAAVAGSAAGTTSHLCESPPRGERGRRLLRQRGEKLERWNQHLYDRGGMRRVHLRGQENILKRLVEHSGAANLGLLMHTLFGGGTLRGLQGRLRPIFSLSRPFIRLMAGSVTLFMNFVGCMARAARVQYISAAA